MRRKDEAFFRRAFAPHPQVKFCNAVDGPVEVQTAHGLLLTGGADIAAEFLTQEVPDPSVLYDPDPARDEWEFAATKTALENGLPILAICKGMQLFNVALGGTLRLDIARHNDPAMKDENVQPLRTDRRAVHRFERVNSSHHQAIDRAADGFEIEAWCATDEIIEQMRLRDRPFAVAVQYHPERSAGYEQLFADFVSHLKS